MENNNFTNVYDELKSRKLIAQLTYEKEFEKLVKENKISVYLGIEPTADSIHIGHFIPLMLMSYFQKHGHHPIILIGGCTAMVGDPSGKTALREMLSKEQIEKNVQSIQKQISKFISFEGSNAAIIVNNADWLADLNYIEFIRKYGVLFNVNRMLNAECFKQRMERGLTFFEMNYMLMQSYDFLHLYETNNCKLEIGGDDQWSNMLAGVELIRKLHNNDGFCLTCPLLLTSDGKKMGKTVEGALWLDSAKTSPYDFYQYFRNLPDQDVENVFRMLTYVPMDEVNRLCILDGEKINEAKKVLAYEVTKLIHGEEEATLAKETSEALFVHNTQSINMPSIKLNIDSSTTLADVVSNAKLAKSKSEAKQLISQGAIVLNDTKQLDPYFKVNETNFPLIICKGKKTFMKIEKI